MVLGEIFFFTCPVASLIEMEVVSPFFQANLLCTLIFFMIIIFDLTGHLFLEVEIVSMYPIFLYKLKKKDLLSAAFSRFFFYKNLSSMVSSLKDVVFSLLFFFFKNTMCLEEVEGRPKKLTPTVFTDCLSSGTIWSTHKIFQSF